MRESELQNQIRLALSGYGIPFRTNSGDFYQGQRVYDPHRGQDILINLRRICGLPKGFSDLLFIGDGKVAFLEVKTPSGKITSEQQKFLDQMQKYHHCAGIVRSVGDALKIIKGE